MTNFPPSPRPSGAWSFLAPFLGAFAAVIVVAAIGTAFFLGSGGLPSLPTPGGKSKDLLQDVSLWQPGEPTAKTLDGTDQPDIGWWASTFDLPKPDAVAAYLNKQGLKVTSIDPAHYQTDKNGATLTYHVAAEVPAQLLHLQKTAWLPTDPDMIRFAHVLVLNDGLPAGQVWNTQSPTVAAEAGTKLNFAWQVRWDKTSNVVETDRLPLSEGVFTQEQVGQYQTETANTVDKLESQIQQINTQIQANTQARLAQVPADPPRPELLPSKWGGDGSGEPTKSAERIGGGAAAGAAGGAIFGAVAGDAGLGAGIGAGAGLLGGLIYDGVSKSNDRKRYERKVAAENEERLDDWHAQIKDLKQQRNAITQNGLAERDRALSDLEDRIAANNGRLDGVAQAAVATSDSAPQVVPSSSTPSGSISDPQPTTDQPSGPIAMNTVATGATPSSSSTTVALVKSSAGQYPYEGNVQVTYPNGQTEMLTQEGRCSKPKVSASGLIGWVYAVGHDPKYGCVKTMLAVRLPNGVVKNFESNAIFIEDWTFADNDTAIVMQSMEHHGPYTYRKYDIATGKTLTETESFMPYDQLPKWAQPVAGDNPN